MVEVRRPDAHPKDRTTRGKAAQILSKITKDTISKMIRREIKEFRERSKILWDVGCQFAGFHAHERNGKAHYRQDVRRRFFHAEMTARLSFNTACELGFRGSLDEWERLMGAVARR